MTELRQRMNNAMLLRGLADRTRESYTACVFGLAKYYRRPPDQLDAAAIQAYLLHLITEKKAGLRQRQSGGLCFSVSVWHRSRPREAARFDIPMAKVPQAATAGLVTRRSRLPLRALQDLARAHPAGNGVRRRIATLRGLHAGTVRYRIRTGPDVHQGPSGQGRQGSLHAALAAPARLVAAVLARLPTAALGVSRTARAMVRSTTRPSSASIARSAMPPVCPRAAASTPCVTPSPPTCSKPASISTPSSACSDTATSARRCATFIWRARG
jgi:hypothetical protein